MKSFASLAILLGSLLAYFQPHVALSASGSVPMELIMVEEKGCMWCARWNREIGPIYPKTNEGKRAPLRRIDKHEALPQDITPVRGFFYTPTFLLLVNGVEKDRIEGYPGEDFFWGLLEQMIASVDKAAEGKEN